MKSKKLFSMFLSLVMIISCIATTPFGVVASEVTGFTNFVENGDMQFGENDTHNWVKSSAIENPTISPVDDTDTDNAGNKVLRFDGTTTTSGTLSYMRYETKLAAGIKYYYSYKVRLAANDTNDTTATPLYLYTDLNAATGTAARPELSKEWATRSGIITPINATNISFKVCNSHQSSSGNANVKSVIYEIDDVIVYDLTNAKTITLPADAAITSTDNVVTAKGVNYVMPGSTVSLTYEKEGYILTADTVALAKDGNTYTFTVGDSDVTISEVEETVATGFENFVENGDMQFGENDTHNWVKSSAIENPTISPVDDTDTDNAGNKVLRFDGTTTTSGTISYMRYETKLAAGTKYYYSYKVRLAANDTNDTTATPLYLYTDLNAATGTDARPELSKEWATRSGIITPSNATNISFKVCNSHQSSSGDANVKSVIYEIDDVIVYDLTNAKTITLPADAAITSTDNVVTAKGVNYAMAGSEITFTYAKAGYKLEATGAELTQNENIYTFIVGDSDVTISEASTATKFENLVTDPGFDGEYDENVWALYDGVGGEISIVTDTENAENKVLKVNCSGNTATYSLVEYKSLSAGTYYLNCKIRLANDNATDAANHYVYANRLSGLKDIYYGASRPAIAKGEWSECYGVFTLTETKNVGFKITSKQENSANVNNAIYEIDDFTIYNLAGAKNITVPAGVEFTSDNVIKSHDGTYYAVTGSEVTFTYERNRYKLESTGAEFTQNENTYTFTVGTSDVIISEVSTVTKFENLVADPGFDGEYDETVWMMSTNENAAGEVSIVTDTKDASNKVLRVDCSSNGEEETNISWVNYKSLDKGTYYLHCKVRLADVDQPAYDNYYVFANSLGGKDNIYWDATRPAVTKDGWADCYGVFSVEKDASSVGFKIIYTQGDSSKNVGRAVYEIDDFTIYSLDNTSNIAVPAGINFTSDNVVKSHDKTYYAVNGSEVTFNYAEEGLDALYINGESATATDGVYSLAVENDVLVLAVANQENEGKVKYAYTAGKPYAIFDEDITLTMIAAGHSDEGALTETYISEVTGVKGQILDLTEVEDFKAISGWANKTIFTWDSITNLMPYRSACVLKDL